MADKSRRSNYLPSERLDLIDVEGLINWTADRIAGNSKTWLSNFKKLVDGFRIKYSGSGNQVTVVNGTALDGTGELILSPHNRALEKTVTLADGNTYWIGVQFRLVDSEQDSRAFWDQTVDNPDPDPDGREFSRNVPTRLSEEWEVVVEATSQPASWDDPSSIIIPLASLRAVGGVVVDPSTGTALSREAAQAAVVEYSGTRLRLSDTRNFPDFGYVAVARVGGSLAGAAASSLLEQYIDIGSGQRATTFTANDRETNTLTLSGSIPDTVIPGLHAYSATANAGSPLNEFVSEDNPATNLKQYLFQAKRFRNDPSNYPWFQSFDSGSAEFEDYFGRAMAQVGLPYDVSAVLGRSVKRTSPHTWEDRGEENITDIYVQLETIKHKLKELQFGQSAALGDASTKPDEWISDPRATTSAGLSLRESIADYVTIGTGGITSKDNTGSSTNLGASYGYFNVDDYASAEDCFSDALSALPDEGGIIYLKPGDYTLATSFTVTKPVTFQGPRAGAASIITGAYVDFNTAAIGTEFRDISFSRSVIDDNPIVDVTVGGIKFHNCEFGEKKPEAFTGTWDSMQALKIDPWATSKDYHLVSKPVVVENCTFYNSNDMDYPAGDRNMTVFVGDAVARFSNCDFYHYGNRKYDYDTSRITVDNSNSIEIHNSNEDASVLIEGCHFFGAQTALDGYDKAINVTVSDCVFNGASALYASSKGVTVSGDDIILNSSAFPTLLPTGGEWENRYLYAYHPRAYTWDSSTSTAPVPEKNNHPSYPFFVVKINQVTNDGGSTITITDGATSSNIVHHSDALGAISSWTDTNNTEWAIVDMPPGVNAIRTSPTSYGWSISGCKFARHSGYQALLRSDETHVSNCSFDGTFSPSFEHSSIWADEGSVTISDSHFSGHAYQAIGIDTAQSVTVSDCVFTPLQTDSGESNTIVGGGTLSDKIAVVGNRVSVAYPVYNVTVKGCEFAGNYYKAVGITVTAQNAAFRVRGFRVTHNVFNNSNVTSGAVPVSFTSSIYTSLAGTDPLFESLDISHNTFRPDAGYASAIRFFGFDENGSVYAGATNSGIVASSQITHNVLAGSDSVRAEIGILLSRYTFKDVDVSHNKMRFLGRAGISIGAPTESASSDAFSACTALDGVSISNNIISDVGNSSATVMYGIAVGAVEAPLSCGSVKISDNSITSVALTSSGTVASAAGIAVKSALQADSIAKWDISGNTVKQVGSETSVVGAGKDENDGSVVPVRGSYGIVFVGSGISDVASIQSVIVSRNHVSEIVAPLSDTSASDVLESAGRGTLSAGIAVKDHSGVLVAGNSVRQVAGIGIAIPYSSRTDTPMVARNNMVSANVVSNCDMSQLTTYPGSVATAPEDAGPNGELFTLPGVVICGRFDHAGGLSSGHSEYTDLVGTCISGNVVSSGVASGGGPWKYGYTRTQNLGYYNTLTGNDPWGVFNAFKLDGPTAGIVFYGSGSSVDISSNTVYNYRGGVFVATADVHAPPLQAVTVTGNNVSAEVDAATSSYAGSYGIHVCGRRSSGARIINGVTVVGNTVAIPGAGFGAQVDDASDNSPLHRNGSIMLLDCAGYNVNGNSVHQLGTFTTSSFAYEWVRGNSDVNNFAWAGISVGTTQYATTVVGSHYTARGSIRGNTIKCFTAPSTTHQGHGIFVAANDDTQVADNHLSNIAGLDGAGSASEIYAITVGHGAGIPIAGAGNFSASNINGGAGWVRADSNNTQNMIELTATPSNDRMPINTFSD